MTGERWDSWPSHVSQKFFRESMESHTKVQSVEKITPGRWDLTLTNGTVVKVFITDVYEFTASDYALLRAKHKDVDCIVSASNWNHFSGQAYDDAATDGIPAVYLGAELMSAIHDFAAS